MRPTSTRERRLIALLILTALVTATYFVAVAPIVAGFAARAERRAQLELRYAHNLRTIASIPALRRHAERQRAATAGFALDVRSTETGREWLKDRMQRAVDAAGGEFREGNDAESPSGWARARASARLTLPQLARVLGLLQNQPPWMIVDTLSVTANDALVTGQASPMDVELEASIPLRAAAAR
jgi:hypothetical protein